MATTTAINGRNFGVFYNNTLIACAKSCTLNIKSNLVDVTCNDSLLWTGNLPGQKDWSVTCDGLLVLNSSWNAVRLMDAITAGTSVVVKVATHAAGVRVAGDKYWWGTAYVTACDLNAGLDEAVSFSATFTGTGLLNSSTKT